MGELTQEKLAAHLKRDKPAQVYLVHGGEELLVDECRAILQNSLVHEERIVLQPDKKAGLLDLLQPHLGNMSLFGESRLIEVLMGANADAKSGNDLLEAVNGMSEGPDTLVICMHGIDNRTQKTKWFGELRAACMSVLVPTVRKDTLPKWVAMRLAKSGRKLTPEAMEFFVEMTEGNLLAANQEVLKICMLFPEGELGIEEVREELVKLSRHSVFALQDAIQSGTPAEAINMLDSLKIEEAPTALVLWALADQVRALIAISEGRRHPGVWGPRRSILESAARQTSSERLLKLLARAQRADLKLRGAYPDREDPWDDFLSIALVLSRMIGRSRVH